MALLPSSPLASVRGGVARRIVLAAGFALAFGAAPAAAADKLDVVATFSILGDMVGEIGGDHVTVTTLVGPDGDAHVYEPTPQDAKTVAAADLVVTNGLGFEGWLDRIVDASGYAGAEVVASDGVTPRAFADAEDHGDEHEHGAYDPHAFQSLANGIVYARNIAAALARVDPANAADYAARLAAYEAQLADLDAEMKREFAAIPADQRKVVTSHDAFGYFGAEYGVAFIAPEGVSTETEASAQDVAKIIRQIRAEQIKAVFVENITNNRLLEQIAAETGARIGGNLYSDALSPADGPAPTYVEMFRNNARQLLAALAVG